MHTAMSPPRVRPSRMQTHRRAARWASVAVLCVSGVALAQTPVHVDPYQQRFGVPPQPLAPLDPRALALPTAARTVVRAHIQALTAPLERRLATLPQVEGGGPLQLMADELRHEMAEVRTMEARGRHLAALQKAQILGFTSDFIKTMIVAILRAQLGAERRGHPQPPSTLPEPRARIADVQARVDAMEPTSLSNAMALLVARSALADCTALVDAFDNRSPALWDALGNALGGMASEKQAAVLPFLAAALVSSMVDIALDDVTVTLELASSDAPELNGPVRADAATLSRLTTAYKAAAISPLSAGF